MFEFIIKDFYFCNSFLQIFFMQIIFNSVNLYFSFWEFNGIVVVVLFSPNYDKIDGFLIKKN